MKKALLLVCSLLFALLLVEVSLRLMRYDVNPHPFWTYHAVLGWVVGRNAPFDEIRDSGFRHRTTSVKKGANTRRVVILGDSFTLATSVSYDRTYPGKLEQSLGSKGDWEVIGVSDRKVKLRCPVSLREFEWNRFCYFM